MKALLLLALAAVLAGCDAAGPAADAGKPEGMPAGQKRQPGEDVPPL